MRPDAVIEALHFEALGTTCGLFRVDVTGAQLADGEQWVREMGARLTRFSPHSELSLINDSAGRWVEVSAETEQVLRESLRAYDLSAGLVNVAVLPAMLAIGYTRPLAHGPTASQLDLAHSAPLLPNVLNVKRGRARLAPNVRIDLGGIAKGWMADQLAACLGDRVLVNLGGDLYARGEWPVAIAGKTYLLRNLGAATSSTRKRRWGDLHHLIDPRTGLPATSRLDEVSVVADTALDAEVLAKTVLISDRAA